MPHSLIAVRVLAWAAMNAPLLRPIAPLAAALALFALPAPAHACSVCGCGDPLVDAASAMPTKGRVRLSLSLTSLTASARSDDDPAMTESLFQLTLEPTLVYSPSERVNVVLSLPIERKAWQLAGGGAPAERLTPMGIGDADLGARYFLWQRSSWGSGSRQNLAVFAGTSLPTGPDDAQLGGVRIDDHAQLGTGSFGPYAGVLYAYHRDPWNLFASVSARVHTTNLYGYHYASALLWAVRGQYRPFDWAAFELGVDGRYNGQDTADGDVQVNTGGLVLDASPGVMLRITGELWLHLRAQIPFATKLNGVQTVGPTFAGFLQYTFG